MFQRLGPTGLACLGVLSCVLGCGGSDGSSSDRAASGPADTPPAVAGPLPAAAEPLPAAPETTPPEVARGATPAEPAPAGARGCIPPGGVSGSPRSITELVTLLNALPKPTSVACLLESLDRPLEVYLTSSTLSAQPSPAARSPRTFLVLGPLLISTVAEGEASHLLEVGYQSAPGRSIKAEIAFPLTRRLTPDRLIEQVRTGRVSMCAGCHTNEQRVPDTFFDTGEDAYESDVLPPYSFYRVPLEALRGEAEACDPAREVERCNLLSALFDHGDVLPSAVWADAEL